MDLPAVDKPREIGLRVDAPGRDLPLVRRQHAENVFGGEQVVASTFRSVVLCQRHLSRHSLSFNRLRRSQVRIVFSGTPWRSASSA